MSLGLYYSIIYSCGRQKINHEAPDVQFTHTALFSLTVFDGLTYSLMELIIFSNAWKTVPAFVPGN